MNGYWPSRGCHMNKKNQRLEVLWHCFLTLFSKAYVICGLNLWLAFKLIEKRRNNNILYESVNWIMIRKFVFSNTVEINFIYLFLADLLFRIARAEYSRGRRCKALGSWGSGNLEGRGELAEGWGKWGQFTSNLRLRWTIPVTAGGCQVSRSGHKGELARGEKSKGKRAMYICNCISCATEW